MAIIRSEIKPNLSSGSDTRSTYDCIAATSADLSDENTSHMGVGSIAFVLETKTMYVKAETGWTCVTS